MKYPVKHLNKRMCDTTHTQSRLKISRAPYTQYNPYGQTKKNTPMRAKKTNKKRQKQEAIRNKEKKETKEQKTQKNKNTQG